MRAVPVQPRIPMTTMMFHKLGPTIATMTIMRGRSGITRKISVRRMSKLPTRPP